MASLRLWTHIKLYLLLLIIVFLNYRATYMFLHYSVYVKGIIIVSFNMRELDLEACDAPRQ